MTRYTNTFLYGIFALMLGLGLYRLWGYTIYEIPYGYDPGFFRFAIDHALSALPNLALTNPPGYPYHEPLFPILVSILSFIGLTPDQIVGPFLGVISILTAFAVYFFGKQLSGKQVGLIAASIFLISIVQYQAYWWNYWRNLVGILLFLVALPLFQKGSYLSILPIAAIMTIHRPTAFFLLLVILAMVIAEYATKRIINKRGLLSFFIAGIIALPLYASELFQLTGMMEAITTTAGGSMASGSFYTSKEFLYLILPYFLVAIPAIFVKTEKKEYDIILVGFIVGIVYSVGRLFFYNRMFVFFDLFCILMAAQAFVIYFGTLKRSLAYMVLILFFFLQGLLYVGHAKSYNHRHMISREEFDIIENLDIIIGSGFTILSTHRGYTPWLLGYSQMRTLAPGLLEDQIWDEATWNRFYSNSTPEEKCQMIQDYKVLAPKLFVFVGANQPSLRLPETCFKPLISNTSHPIVYEVRY